MADVLDFAKMKVADLKKELKERGLSTTGAKSELLERLKAASSATADSDVLLEADESIDLNNSNVLPAVVEEEKSEPKVVSEANPEKTDSSEEHEKVEHVKVTLASSPTETDRLKKRAERFGAVNEDIKKQQRAERFGLPSPGSGKLSVAGTGANSDTLKKRAERFGQVVSSSLTKEDEAEKLRKRKERFGDVTTTANNTPSKFAKITFNSSDDEKKKKRAERFGIV